MTIYEYYESVAKFYDYHLPGVDGELELYVERGRRAGTPVAECQAEERW